MKTFYENILKQWDGSLLKEGLITNLYDQDGNLVCSIKIAHDKNTKREVVAHSIHKIEKKFKERGLKWPPLKK